MIDKKKIEGKKEEIIYTKAEMIWCKEEHGKSIEFANRE